MAEYIEREAVLKIVDRRVDLNAKTKPMFQELISLPAADVAPLVHGRWVYDKNATDWGIGGYVCSECKNKNNNLPCNKVKSALMFSGARYCPNCGAKIAGGDNDA